MAEPDEPPPDEPPPDKPARDEGTPRRILAYGGLGLVLLGLGKLTADALSLERSEAAWLPIIAGTVALMASAVWLALDAPAPPRLIEEPPAEARRRTIIAWAVAGLLLAQALIPLRYYLGDDPFDERFSWRMFSAVRVYQCQLAAFDDVGGVPTQVPLMREIHVGWVTTMRRNRQAVQERYLRWRCDENEIEGARIVNRCTSPEGRREDVIRTIDCESGKIEEGDGT